MYVRPLTHRFVLACAWVAVVSCQDAIPLYPPTAPPEIREACALAERKCTACHDRDRLLYTRQSAPAWRATIERMRLIPGSAISPLDGEIILRCMSFSAEAATPQ